MILWTPPLLFFRPRSLHPDIFCKDCPFISAGDWKPAGKEAAYFLPHPSVIISVFCVNSGSGELEYQGKRHKLGKGDCVFIDCQLPYSHSTDTDLWSLSWIHFSGVAMQTVYQKYQERGGRPVFKPDNFAGFQSLHQSVCCKIKM